jgi:hypothetical protein
VVRSEQGTQSGRPKRVLVLLPVQLSSTSTTAPQQIYRVRAVGIKNKRELGDVRCTPHSRRTRVMRRVYRLSLARSMYVVPNMTHTRTHLREIAPNSFFRHSFGPSLKPRIILERKYILIPRYMSALVLRFTTSETAPFPREQK